MSASCGFWRSGRGGLIAAVVDLDGFLAAVEAVPDDEEERCSWLSDLYWRHGPILELVLTEPLARHDGLGRLALMMGHRVWVAPANLVAALAQAAWYRPAPRQRAVLLARLPRVALLRAALRRVLPDPGPDQLHFAFPLPKPRCPSTVHRRR